jgi:predicted ATPase/DNA-binding winged helix-turn-helix (wHTH) protein
MSKSSCITFLKDRHGDPNPIASVVKPVGADSESEFRFGEFRLLPLRRLLLKGNEPVQFSSRALDILITLLERPGEIVTKEDLMKRAWPNTFVEPGNLSVNISALRRALGGSRGADRCFINVPGRGYCFTAPVTKTPNPEHSQFSETSRLRYNLPKRLRPIIGRVDFIASISAQLAGERMVTIVGPGGVGKTTVAIAIAEQHIGNHKDGVWIIDLAELKHPSLLTCMVRAAIGLEDERDESLDCLMWAMRRKQLLLLLDNCGHHVSAAAEFAEAALRNCPQVQILATSREPLCSEGERVFRLPPLCNASATVLTADQALTYSAIKLFTDRAAAALGVFSLSDADAAVVAEICRRVDGIPLAIELAAARVDCFGIQGLITRLDDGLSILSGAPTRPPRQRTMRATLDWSYDLLDQSERALLCQLSTLAKPFSIQEAVDAFGSNESRSGGITEQLSTLIRKSLIISEPGDGEPKLRLLRIVKAYAQSERAEEPVLSYSVADRRGERPPRSINGRSYHVRNLAKSSGRYSDTPSRAHATPS